MSGGIMSLINAPDVWALEIMESNGSSSMATVCGSCLSLMDAGVPMKHPDPLEERIRLNPEYIPNYRELLRLLCSLFPLRRERRERC